MVQDGLCQSLKTTSRCDMDTVDVDVKDLIFSTSILGITWQDYRFLLWPQDWAFLSQKKAGETLRFPVGRRTPRMQEIPVGEGLL